MKGLTLANGGNKANRRDLINRRCMTILLVLVISIGAAVLFSLLVGTGKGE